MAKTLGYVLAILGLIGIAAYSIPQVKSAIPSIDVISDTMLIIVSLILAIVGVFLVVKGGGSRTKGKEVPIYHGKRVVGYRRH